MCLHVYARECCECVCILLLCAYMSVFFMCVFVFVGLHLCVHVCVCLHAALTGGRNQGRCAWTGTQGGNKYAFPGGHLLLLQGCVGAQ